MVAKHIVYSHIFAEVRKLTSKLAIIQLILCLPLVIYGSQSIEEQIFYSHLKTRAIQLTEMFISREFNGAIVTNVLILV